MSARPLARRRRSVAGIRGRNRRNNRSRYRVGRRRRLTAAGGTSHPLPDAASRRAKRGSLIGGYLHPGRVGGRRGSSRSGRRRRTGGGRARRSRARRGTGGAAQACIAPQPALVAQLVQVEGVRRTQPRRVAPHLQPRQVGRRPQSHQVERRLQSRPVEFRPQPVIAGLRPPPQRVAPRPQPHQVASRSQPVIAGLHPQPQRVAPHRTELRLLAPVRPGHLPLAHRGKGAVLVRPRCIISLANG